MSDLRAAAASFTASRKGVPSPPSDDGDLHYADHHIIFHHDFTLGKAGEVFPAGRYAVETGDTDVERNGHRAQIRTSTMLIVPSGSGSRAVKVDGRELEAALAADAERAQLAGQNENPDSGNAEGKAAGGTEDDILQAQLAKHGIERVPADVFLWQGYRYSNASDAVAAALRVRTV